MALKAVEEQTAYPQRQLAGESHLVRDLIVHINELGELAQGSPQLCQVFR